MNNNEELKNYIRDTLSILVNNASDIKKNLKVNKEDGFECGELMGYIHTISLFKQQAEAFGLNPKDLGIDIDPEKYLLDQKSGG